MKYKKGDTLLMVEDTSCVLLITGVGDNVYYYTYKSGLHRARKDWHYQAVIDNNCKLIRNKKPALTCKLEIDPPEDQTENQNKSIDLLEIED